MTKIRKLIIFCLTLLSSVLFSSCYSWWETKNDMNSTNAHISLGDFLYNAPKIKSLDSPVQVIASQGFYSGSIKLHWTDVEHAASYRIERATVTPDLSGNYSIPDESDFEILEKNVYSTNYTDFILSNPVSNNDEYSYRYYYRISAENHSKGYESSEFTDINQDDTEALGWLLPPPQNFDADKGKSTEEIKLSWKLVEGVDSYVIYRTDSSKKDESGNLINGIQIATVRGTINSFVDEITASEQGIEFYYQVQAKLGNGSKSALSNIAMGYALAEGAPATPANVQVVDGYGTSINSINIKWDAVSGSASQTITYSLFRTSSMDSNYVLVKNNIPQGTTSHIDTENLKPGLFYYYYVQTIAKNNTDGKTQKSAFSESGPEGISPAMGFLLSPPSNTDVADGKDDEHIIVKFSPAIGGEYQSESYQYNIYYDLDQYGQFVYLAEGNITSLVLEDDGFYAVEVDKHPFYKISTINSSGTESALSSTIAPSPLAPEQVTASKTKGGILTSNYSPNTNDVYPVLITWEKPDKDTPYGYNVYRSNKRDSSFRKLNDDVIIANDNQTTFSYIDENPTAQPANLYYYKVISVNAIGTGKKGNNPIEDTENKCRGYGAITRDTWLRYYNPSVMHSQSKLTLMHKSGNTDKLGSETIRGDISGTLSYNAAIAGLGAEIVMHYENYADFYINNDPNEGPFFVLTGNTDTTSNMSANGHMHETVKCTGMYPGSIVYNNLEIKNGAAGGGYYIVQTRDLNENIILDSGNVDWKVGEEGK